MVSSHNVLNEREDAEITNDPVDTDDPVTCVIYTHEKDLLEKSGLEVTRTYKQALYPDKGKSGTLGGDTTTLEITQIDSYDTFINKGHHIKVKTPDRFKKI
jgi:hypothetical protein